MPRNTPQPLVDAAPYSVVCAGVRHSNLTLTQAQAKARALVEEWLALGYRFGRRATVFYRDGSTVETVGVSE